MRLLILAVAMWISLAPSAYAALDVVYPNVDGLGEKAYGYQVLDLALRKSGVAYTLTLAPQPVNHARARVMIETGEISTYDFGSSPAFEQRFLPVYFPIDRGLNGYRLFVVHRDSIEEFSKIKSAEQLREKTAGQGFSWADIPILEQAGIKVFTAPFGSLFKMVDARRFDFLPLGANEVHYLLEQHRRDARNVVVESNIVLIYPFGRLFFVRKENVELRDAILKGLEMAFADGAFQKLLQSYFAIDDRAMAARTQIHIDNPFTTAEFRKIPQKYFYAIGR